MSNNLLIYIGENQHFDLALTIQTISCMDGVSNAKEGSFIGAVFECNYSYAGRTTIIGISEDLQVVSARGIGIDSAEFAVRFQQCNTIPLHVIDMSYAFDLELSKFQSGQELMLAIEAID